MPPRTVERDFPGETSSAGAARGVVREHLDGALADDCALLVSELVANAVVHGGSAVRLSLTAHQRWVYVEIADDGGGLPSACRAEPDATEGRGLLIVNSLAREWGVIPLQDRGKVVWFILGEA